MDVQRLSRLNGLPPICTRRHALVPFMKQILLLWFLGLSLAPCQESEFEKMRQSYGKMTILAGMGKEDKGQNSWKAHYESKPATEAELSNPHITMGDDRGNYYIADKHSNRILKVATNGVISTYAGTGRGEFDLEQGKAAEVGLYYPNGLYVQPNGIVYILDNFNNRVRKVDKKGHLTTVFEDPAGFHHERGLWVNPYGDLIYYVGTGRNSRLMKWNPNGGCKEIADGFFDLAYLTVDPKGNILITEQGDNLVHRISPDGKTRPVIAGNGTTDDPIDGKPATEIGLHEVRGIALRKDGSYFLCTHKGGDIIFVDSKGIANTFIHGSGRGNVWAGDGEPVTSPGEKISEPRAVTLAPNGDLIITCNDHGFVRIVKKR